ncbi:hypothetical protein P3S67_010069 [Capsicum chacoense]
MELEEGYRFHPTDSELLTYLVRFIAGKNLYDDGYITEHDVYKQEPWVTYRYGCHCGGEDDGDTSIYRYFITPMHKNKIKKKNKSLAGDAKKDRFCRIVGKKLGTWKQQDKGKNVIMSSFNNQSRSFVIGRRKSLCYETSRSCPDDGKWLMKEYVFCDTILNRFTDSKFRDYVICAIKRKSPKKSSNGTRCSNVTTTMDTVLVSFVEPSMDQEYNATTPLQVESMVESDEPEEQIQEAAGLENDAVLALTTTSQIQEHNDWEIIPILDQDFETIRPINAVENPMADFDEFEGEENGFLGIQEFENTIPESSLPKELVLLDKDQPQCVNEDHTAHLELENKDKSFLELLSGGADYSIRNNHERIQEVPGEENGHLELYTFSQIQEPVAPDFKNANSELNMPDIFDTLDEYMVVTVESNEPRMQTREAAGEVNGLLGLNALFPQEPAVPENNVPEMFDMGETLLEKNQTQHQPAPQEESETLCETGQSSFVVSDLGKAMLDHTTMEERLAALRANQSSLMSDQQSWLSKAHLQDMLL